MTAPVTVVRHMVRGDNNACLGVHVLLWCPGCDELHGPTFRCPDHGGPATGPVWDGDPHSEPFTMSPSLLVTGHDTVCHSFIRDGVWDFLGDSTHKLAGQKTDLVPVPDWLASS